MFSKLFLEHPRSVGETYLGHMAFAGWFASKLFIAGGAALTHALFPFMCERTASNAVAELYERTRGSAPDKNETQGSALAQNGPSQTA